MSSYGDGCAEFYDEIYGPAHPNVVRALGRLVAGGNALEFGIGTGRTALALRDYCASLVGIESSRAMLNQLAQNPAFQRVRVVEGDFSNVRLGERFDLIYVLVNTLSLLESVSEQRRCLGNAREMLADRGVLVIEAYRPCPTEEVTNEGTYSRIVYTSQGARRYEVRLCYQDTAELDEIAGEVGLVLLDRWSNWSGTAYTPESEMHISLYGRPEVISWD